MDIKNVFEESKHHEGNFRVMWVHINISLG